jgi:hypothetical protein
MKLVSSVSDFHLTLSPLPGNRLPKRAGSIEARIGSETPATFPVTNNRAWAAGADVLFYPWLEIDGKAYYATVTAAEWETFNEYTYSVEQGTAKRKDPPRVTAATEREAARVSAFKATFAAR